MLQEFLEQKLTVRRSIDRTYNSFKTLISELNRMCGRRHGNLSRSPANLNGSYRVCIDCGAHMIFDMRNFKTLGTYYYPNR